MALTYKDLFEALTDLYIKDSKYADGGLPCCQFTDKSKCLDLKEKGEAACRLCVVQAAKSKAIAISCRKNQRIQRQE